MSCPAGMPTELFSPGSSCPSSATTFRFNRQAEIFKRQGIDLNRGTLGNWVCRACFHLMPIINPHEGPICVAPIASSWTENPRAGAGPRAERATKSGFFWAVVIR